MADTIQPLDQVPEAFSEIGAKINEIIALLKPLMDISGQDPVKVDISDTNIIVSIVKKLEDAGIIPRGINTNDTLRWDASANAFVIFPAPPTSGTWIKGVVDNTMTWIEGAGC